MTKSFGMFMLLALAAGCSFHARSPDEYRDATHIHTADTRHESAGLAGANTRGVRLRRCTDVTDGNIAAARGQGGAGTATDGDVIAGGRIHQRNRA